MNTSVEKIYKVYRSVIARNFKNIPRYELNVLFNAEQRIKKDLKYAKALSEYCTMEEKPIGELIDRFFYEYNNRYGLEIREDLIEYENTDLACGCYFIIDSFVKEGEALCSRAPTEFVVGDIAYVTVKLYSHETNQQISAPMLSLRVITDDGDDFTKIVKDSDFIDFEATLSRPGSLKFKVMMLDEESNMVLGSETAYGGIIFSRKEIATSHCPPEDLYDFWDTEIERMLKVNPCDTQTEVYLGNVKTWFDITEKNKFRILKVNTEYAELLKSIGQNSPTEHEVFNYSIYEVNLKSPGPCPATAYVSIPKNASKKSIPIHFVFDGYGVRMPAPVCVKNQITVHPAHHGYELCRDSSYYKEIWDNVCKSYCRGNGDVNSDFADIHDCYPLYILLRNLQMLRFLINPELSGMIDGLHDFWNGEITMEGSSMGGFQSICVAALASILRKKTGGFTVTSVVSTSPAFGNVAASADGRVASTFFTYKDGANYFDTAILATCLDAPTSIPRASLGDEVCPATSITAIYNSIPQNVRGEIRYIQNSSHGYLPDDNLQKWIIIND